MADLKEGGAQFFSRADVKLILNALAAKGITPGCPACNRGVFTIVDGFFVPRMVGSLDGVPFNFAGDQSVHPSVALTCQNCGYLRHFGVELLGLGDLFRRSAQDG